MKKLLLVLLLVYPCYLFAQKQDTIPFKDADKFIVKNNISAEENFKIIKKALNDNEIEITTSDQETHQIKSGLISMGQKNFPTANYYFVIFSKDNQITIKSYFKSGISTGGFIKLEDSYQLAKYSYPKKRNLIFEKIQTLIKGVPGTGYYSSDN